MISIVVLCPPFTPIPLFINFVPPDFCVTSRFFSIPNLNEVFAVSLDSSISICFSVVSICGSRDPYQAAVFAFACAHSCSRGTLPFRLLVLYPTQGSVGTKVRGGGFNAECAPLLKEWPLASAKASGSTQKWRKIGEKPPLFINVT